MEMNITELLHKLTLEEKLHLLLDRTNSSKDFLSDDRYRDRANRFLEILQIDETHMLYQMLQALVD